MALLDRDDEGHAIDVMDAISNGRDKAESSNIWPLMLAAAIVSKKFSPFTFRPAASFKLKTPAAGVLAVALLRAAFPPRCRSQASGR